MQVIETQLAVGAYALAAWFCLYLLIASLLRMWARTSHLPHAHRAHITESFVSGVQGAACAVVGIATVIACRNDVMGEKYPLAVHYSSIGTAYFIYDLWAMYRSHIARISTVNGIISTFVSYLKSDLLMVVHHMTIVFLLFPAVVYRSPMGHFFLGCFFCTELSTPFVNARVILSLLGLKNSKIYIVNGLLMMTVFAMCRVALFPIMYAVYLSQQTTAPSHIQALASIPMTCHLSCLLVLAPQLYWFGLMVKGALAVMKMDTSKVSKVDWCKLIISWIIESLYIHKYVSRKECNEVWYILDQFYHVNSLQNNVQLPKNIYKLRFKIYRVSRIFTGKLAHKSCQ